MAGDPAALGSLMPLVFAQLREMASVFLQQERPDHTLQPTALVNELYLRLTRCETVSWENRAHFFAFAAQAMRRILVDHARERHAAKRGGAERPVPLECVRVACAPPAAVVALDDALQALAALNERQVRIVEMRSFVGLEHAEIAEVLGVTTRTVEREWASARAWLYREIGRRR